MRKIYNIETFIDNLPLYGISILPERFGLKTIIEKQEMDKRNSLPSISKDINR